MIDPKELRIGNWVIRKNRLGDELFDTVGSVGHWGINGECTHSGDVVGDECWPIDVTPEILEGAGFERMPEFSETHWKYKLTTKTSTKLFYHCGTSSFVVGAPVASRTTVLYVHQLQNLVFALTGEELEVKL